MMRFVKMRQIRDESGDSAANEKEIGMKMMMRFVRMRQIRDESGDNAAHGKEIRYEK